MLPYSVQSNVVGPNVNEVTFGYLEYLLNTLKAFLDIHIIMTLLKVILLSPIMSLLNVILLTVVNNFTQHDQLQFTFR